MKTVEDIRERLRMELEQWYIKQCRNLYKKYYLYYMEANACHDGGILIAATPPANSECKLATKQVVRVDFTIEQNLKLFAPVLNRLPVLSV